jgi:hypothetical protein
MSSRWQKIWAFAVFTMLFVVAPESVFAQTKGGGKTPSPVVYHVKVFSMPADHTGDEVSVRGMNNLGQVVGHYSVDGGNKAFIYDPVVDPDRAIDLHDHVQPPDGFYFRLATGINDRGEIVGGLRSLDDEVRRPFVITWREGKPTAELLPHDEAWLFTSARGINNSGDVLVEFETLDGVRAYVYNPLWEPLDMGEYILPIFIERGRFNLSVLLNDQRPPQVAGVDADTKCAFRYTLGGELKIYRDLNYDENEVWVSGLNNHGVICGRRRNKRTNESYKHTGTQLVVLGQTNSAVKLNDSGDAPIQGSKLLYHEGSGMLDLANLVKRGDPADLKLWTDGGPTFWGGVTERGALSPNKPNFPALSVTLWGSSFGYRGVILIPVE